MTGTQAGSDTLSCLSVDHVTATFGHRRQRTVAVADVSLQLPRGGAVGIVGESGSGKSTLAKVIAGLVAPVSGQVSLYGQPLGRSRSRAQMRRIQLVFQNPSGSLNPRMTVAQHMGDALAAAGFGSNQRKARIDELLAAVQMAGVPHKARPAELSGGQRQRLAIARALAGRPEVLICDEVTSALDVSARGAMLNLLRSLQRSQGFGLIFISHDIAAVRHVTTDIAVMYLGRIIERGPARALVADPQHPYTRLLIASVPRLGVAPSEDGTDFDPPDPTDPPSGCPFHPRCSDGPSFHPERTICSEIDPQAVAATRKQYAACHFAAANNTRRSHAVN